jgi:hypothetical protein
MDLEQPGRSSGSDRAVQEREIVENVAIASRLSTLRFLKPENRRTLSGRTAFLIDGQIACAPRWPVSDRCSTSVLGSKGAMIQGSLISSWGRPIATDVNSRKSRGKITWAGDLFTWRSPSVLRQTPILVSLPPHYLAIARLVAETRPLPV